MKRILYLTLAFLSICFVFLSTTYPQTGGTIAFIRGRAEIHLIEPGGSNDRRIWAIPRPELAATMGINGLAWRPDGKEIAFTSSHEAVQSLYLSDLYTILPDGSDLRKITNPPDASDF